MKKKPNYKVQVYLGKEMKADMELQAKFIGVPLSTYVRLVLETGYDFAKMLDKGVKNNANK